MFRYSFIAASLLTLGACAAAPPPRTLPATLDSTTLPESAKAALDAAYPNKSWSIAAVPAAATSCLSGKTVSPIVAADFDADNASDLAAAVTTPAGTHLVVLLQRDDHYALFDAGALDANTAIGVEKRGAPFTKADTLFHDYYSADTLTTYTCSGASTSYPWGGLDFYKVALAPSPK